MNRLILAEKYVKGEGIEIGALTSPWKNPNNASIKYLDRYPRSELVKQYPNDPTDKIPETDILEDGATCASIAAGSLDFAISSHVIEHVEDAIGTIFNWLRIVKVGGHVVMAVPEKTKTFDSKREPTTWDHFLRDYKEYDFRSSFKRSHLEEYFKTVDGLLGEKLNSSVEWAIRENHHIHFHVWTESSLREFFDNVEALNPVFKTVEFKMVDHEVFVVLRKVAD